VLLRGVNNLGGKKVAMADLRQVVISLGHTEVMTYIQSGNVVLTPRRPDGNAPGHTDTAALAAELERAITNAIGVHARALVLSGEELAGYVRDNPYAGEANPRLLHAVFLPDAPGPDLTSWVADAVRQVRANGSQDEAEVIGRAVYLHTPGGYPGSELRRVFARVGGPMSATLAGTARNWATVSKLVSLCAPEVRGAR
jgi:uncharacterized protein (DUF1697 family)